MKTYYDMSVAYPHEPGEWCVPKSFDIYTLCCFQTPFTCNIDGVLCDGNTGDLLLMEPGKIVWHGPRADAEEGYVNGYIRLGPAGEVMEWLKKYPLPLNAPFSVNHDNFLRPYIEAVLNESRDSEAGCDDLTHCILLRMLIEVHRAYNRTITPDSLKRVRSVHNAVWGTPEQDWDLSEMARMSGYSVSRFSALYRSEYGASPVQDLISARINKAKNLLLHSAMTVSEVAVACGFCTVYHFSRQFRKFTNLSPSQYVKHKQKWAR